MYVKKKQKMLWSLICCLVVCVLAHLEQTGMLFDQTSAARYTREISSKMELLQREANGILGRFVNLGSPQQMAAVLYDELGLETSKVVLIVFVVLFFFLILF
jgi:DNA polymerase I-like protein with 3'-5' exonuclease and polymerase domains